MRQLVLALLAVALLAGPAVAQTVRSAEGVWGQLGLGAGAFCAAGCEASEWSAAGTASIGYALSDRVLVAASIDLWTRSESVLGIDIGTTAMVTGVSLRVYPWAHRHLYLLAGIGRGSVDYELSVDGPSLRITERGAGGMLGAGYDVRVRPGLSLTPYGRVAAIRTSEGTARLAHVGVALTIH